MFVDDLNSGFFKQSILSKYLSTMHLFRTSRHQKLLFVKEIPQLV